MRILVAEDDKVISLQICALLKKSGYAPTPVFDSSVGHRGDGARVRKLGIASYLVKPVRQSMLLDAVLAVLARKDRGDASPQPSPGTR